MSQMDRLEEMRKMQKLLLLLQLALTEAQELLDKMGSSARVETEQGSGG